MSIEENRKAMRKYISQIRKQVYQEVYNRIDEGVCHMCKFCTVDCHKTCNELQHEKLTLMDWLDGKVKEQSNEND